MARKPRTKTRSPHELQQALERLAPLAGEPVVDAAIAALRWAAGLGEWRDVWTELEVKYGRHEEDEAAS